jgi:hypothetical protein
VVRVVVEIAVLKLDHLRLRPLLAQSIEAVEAAEVVLELAAVAQPVDQVLS